MERPFLAALIPRDQTFEDDEAAVHMQKQEARRPRPSRPLSQTKRRRLVDNSTVL